LYVWGDHDSVVARSGANWTARYVTGPFDFKVLDGVTHWIPEEVPQRLTELIIAHLRANPHALLP
jgi:pimeloyl-ACP methyl ester carboxylesterase